MKNYILSITCKIFVSCLLGLLSLNIAEGQRLISTTQSNVDDASSDEDVITVTLSTSDIPTGLSLEVYYVDVEYNKFNTYKNYEIISPNVIKFRLKKNYFNYHMLSTLHVKTNVGKFDVPIRQSGYYHDYIKEGRVLGYDPESKLYYDTIIALPNFQACIVQVLTPSYVIRPRMKWWREYYGISGKLQWDNYYQVSSDTLRVVIYESSYFIRTDGRDYEEESIMPGVYVDMNIPKAISQVKLYPTIDSVRPDEKFELVPTKRYAPFYKGSYTWEKKEKDGTWTLMAEYTNEDLVLEKGIKQNTVFRRGYKTNQVQIYSNEIPVYLKGLDGGLIECRVNHLNKGDSITLKSRKVPNTTSVTYTWERKTEDDPVWRVIPGANEKSYTEMSLTGNTWFRRNAHTDIGNFYSNACFVWVDLNNHVKTVTYLEEGIAETGRKMITDVQYQDGGGQVIQEVQVNGMPTSLGSGDIIIPRVIGLFGREEKSYLPYGKLNNNGAKDKTPLVANNWSYLGSDDQSHAFSVTEYDNSPLDRVIKQTGAGKNWQVNNRGVTTTYLANSANQVKLLGVDSSGTLTFSGMHYPAKMLILTRVEDEDGCVIEKYQDREGKIILSVMLNDGARLETYQVYDNRGLLRYVLSPEASAGLTTNVNVTLIKQYAYYYEYDGYGRMTLKRLPGCDPEYLVYDQRDRVVMSQDGNQRAENVRKWSYKLYDKQGREVETGHVLLPSNISHATLQSEASKSENYIPAGVRSALQYTVYDSYPTSGEIVAKSFSSTNGYSSTYSTRVSGLKTVMKTKVLEENVTDKWLTTTIYYDDRGRVIQTVGDNILGYVSRTDVKYDFTDKVLKKREAHGYNTANADILETTNSYDDRGRLLSTMTVLNGGTPAVIQYAYDVVGRLTTQRYKTGTTFLSETLSYNARGWLTGKESGAFKMKLRYESPLMNAVARYNGNISEWEWQHGTSSPMVYTFAYDGVNRLTGNRHYRKSGNTWSELTGNSAFTEKNLQYDRNGNIQALTRTGTAAATLSYTYSGNQLKNLSKNGVSGNYLYDKNGNMINDSRKNLNLSFNVLNLLSAVKTGTALTTRYSYLANGTKLGVFDGGTNGFYYLGSLTYVKTGNTVQLESGLFEKGRLVANASTRAGSDVRYFLTDHLGSVRAVLDQTGTVKERNDYYPFGGRYAVANSGVDAGGRWKYNGKEEQVTGNLGWLDYGARMYDWELGRWFIYDPLAEVEQMTFSPYHYCLNNPVLHVDSDGQIAPLLLWGAIIGGKMLLGAIIDTSVQYGMSRALGYSPEDAWNNIDWVSTTGSSLISAFTAPGVSNGLRMTGTFSTLAIDAMCDLKNENSEMVLGIGGFERKSWSSIGIDFGLGFISSLGADKIVKASKTAVLNDLKPKNYAPLKQADKELVRNTKRVVYSYQYAEFVGFMLNASIGSNGLLGQGIKPKTFLPYSPMDSWWNGNSEKQEKDSSFGIFNMENYN